MNKKFTSGLIALSLGLSISGIAVAQDKLIVYTSMKESLIGALKTKFNEKYPDIAMDYQSAGAGKLMAKIAAEKEAEIANVEEVEAVEINEDSELVLRDNPKMAVAEDFRTIRTSLYFSLNNQNSNTVLFCSSRAHEGKSFIISNLAVAFAKTNKKVLLIDCDMRLGRQHEIFELSNQFGLSNILAEGDLKKLRQYALKTNVKNLEVITRGVVPPNPSELLESKKMEMLLSEVKKHYDYVLIDGTPIEGISDSLILAKRADRVIMVCAANETTIEDLQNSKRALEAIEINMPGVILNQVVDKRHGQKNNYYSYYNNY